MHKKTKKNFLFIKMGIDQVAAKAGKTTDQVRSILSRAREKMYAARLQRPTPYVDKTIYVNWNALMISAYLQAAEALDLEATRRFALKSLDRILSYAWDHTA